MEVKLIAIDTHDDLKQAQALASSLMDSEDPADRARLRAQVQLIKAYETKHWPMEAATASDILQYLMEQHDLTPADLAPILGTRSRVSEVINGKRPLSISMVRKLRSSFNISADALIPA